MFSAVIELSLLAGQMAAQKKDYTFPNHLCGQTQLYDHVLARETEAETMGPS